jgi:hypothetical protein
MKYRLLFLVFAISTFAGAQDIIHYRTSEFLMPQSSNGKNTIGESFTTIPQNLAVVLGTNQKIEIEDFPIGNNRSANLVLRPMNITDGTTRYFLGNNPVQGPEVHSFAGFVRDQPGSKVFVSWFENNLVVNIETPDGNFVMAPEKDGSNTLVLVPDSKIYSLEKLPFFNCTNEDPNSFSPIKYKNSLTTNKLLQVNIAAEADSSFYARAGGTAPKAIAYIISLFGMVSMYYENEIGTTIHLTWIKVWDKNDPYQVKGNAYALPTPVQAYWRKNYKTVPRNVAHVMTSTSYGSGGYGWIGTLCDTVYGYSVSGPTCSFTYPNFSFNYDVYIVAHELGHNFGAQHTYTCFYGGAPIDTCGTKDDPFFAYSDACLSKPFTAKPNPGSFMSYCGNTNNKYKGVYSLRMTFLPVVAAVMRATAESKSCIVSPATPTLILTAPRGDVGLYNSNRLNMTWLYTNVTGVNIDYSTNKGVSWNSIATNIPIQYPYSWDISKLSLKNVLVRIISTSSSSVGDTSLASFDINGDLGIVPDPLAVKELSVFPNPAKNTFNIHSGISGPAILRVRDIFGKTVYYKNSENISTEIVDVSQLPAGIFEVTVQNNNEVGVGKIVIEK